MHIKHKVVEAENFESLQVVDTGKVIESIGVVLPGEYTLKPHARPESIKVIKGCLIINGVTCTPGSEPYTFMVMVPVTIKARQVSLYMRV